jgi:hypothetical protein
MQSGLFVILDRIMLIFRSCLKNYEINPKNVLSSNGALIQKQGIFFHMCYIEIIYIGFQAYSIIVDYVNDKDTDISYQYIHHVYS